MAVTGRNAAKGSGELPACPVEAALSVIGDKWTVLILRDLMPGKRRFGELRRSVGGVSQKVLAGRLRRMEADGLLTRRVFAEVPPRVEYGLTELGRSLGPVLGALEAWGRDFKARRAAWLSPAAGNRPPDATGGEG